MTTRQKLKDLASNLWWSWHPDVLDLFAQLNRGAFKASGYCPLAALRDADPAVLASDEYRAQVDIVHDRLQDYMQSEGDNAGAPRTAYFCMEFGLHESLPLYSGGLGILAGDHLKAASDVGLPLTAVGIFLRDGYFKQYFDSSGHQQDEYPSIDATLHAFEPVEDEAGEPVNVTVHVGEQPVYLRAWKLQVGRVELFLLDADFERNGYKSRFLTRRLYQGDRETRIQQEIILGIGGVRLLRALGKQIDVYHMNEGHCAFLTLELLRETGTLRDEDAVRSRCVFTTHTPVMAGHDRFNPELLTSQLAHFREELGMTKQELLSFGRVNPQDAEEAFTMTILGMKLSRSSNGVSRLNGEVARRQWHHMYADLPLDDVPIGHITNGIHLPTWTSPAARPFLGKYLGDWEANRSDASTWAKVNDIPAREFWAYRNRLRSRLIDFVRAHVSGQSIRQHVDLDPNALTIGFARRFATYKRAPLFFHDPERAARLMSDSDRPVQLIYAGKAHPADREAQKLIGQILEMTGRDAFRGKVVFLENYDMKIGRMLVSGCDVWLNNPRRPHEASGTSGQKTAIHGGLNLSVLDGWWPEGFNGRNGWAIGQDASHEYRDPAIQDPEDAAFLYTALEEEIIPMFFDKNTDGVPERWVSTMQQAMSSLSYAFSAHRMILDYIEQIYKMPEDR